MITYKFGEHLYSVPDFRTPPPALAWKPKRILTGQSQTPVVIQPPKRKQLTNTLLLLYTTVK